MFGTQTAPSGPSSGTALPSPAKALSGGPEAPEHPLDIITKTIAADALLFVQSCLLNVPSGSLPTFLYFACFNQLHDEARCSNRHFDQDVDLQSFCFSCLTTNAQISGATSIRTVPIVTTCSRAL